MGFRYGVFQLGQIWTVIGDDGLTLGFPCRSHAMAEVLTLICGHRACGERVELLVQNEDGRLENVPDINDHLETSHFPECAIS